MKAEHTELLIECYERMREVSALMRRKNLSWWDRREVELEAELGPRYGCGDWFGVVPEHQRMRYRRALDDFERQGLLETNREWGRRLSHVKLTAKGRKLAKKLTAETAPS